MFLNKKEIMIESLLILVGNFILAVGVTCFILPNNVLTGGLAGIAVAICPLLNIEETLLINALTIILFFVGAIILGKRFAMKTILSTIVYPLMISFLSWFIEANGWVDSFLMDKYLATIYGGALMGFGVGLVFKTGASTGGMDIPPLILNKFTHISLPVLITITDALTVLLGLSIHGLQAALTGILSVWVSTYMIEKAMLLGGHDAMNVMIISSHYDAIKAKVHDLLERGTTIIEAMGGYSNQKKPVLMVVVSKKQLPHLQRMIAHEDPEAFVIVTNTHEVQGLGFSYEEEL
jgi:uncharacterized membrane-anchored protein YitT (DUF2179 family)